MTTTTTTTTFRTTTFRFQTTTTTTTRIRPNSPPIVRTPPRLPSLARSRVVSSSIPMTMKDDDARHPIVRLVPVPSSSSSSSVPSPPRRDPRARTCRPTDRPTMDDDDTDAHHPRADRVCRRTLSRRRVDRINQSHAITGADDRHPHARAWRVSATTTRRFDWTRRTRDGWREKEGLCDGSRFVDVSLQRQRAIRSRIDMIDVWENSSD